MAAMEEPETPLSSRRRSSRLSATEEISVPTVKRPIVLKKIRPPSKLTPCKTAAPRRSPRISAEAVKENVCPAVVMGRSAERRVNSSAEAVKENVCPAVVTGRSAERRVNSSAEAVKENVCPVVTGRGAEGQVNSSAEAVKENVCPVVVTGRSAERRVNSSLPLSTIPLSRESPLPPFPDLPSAQKVRRSYSRLSPCGTQVGNGGDGSDTSTPDPRHPARRSFFGFERLLHAEPVSPVKASSPSETSARLAAPAAQHTCGAIPGVANAKEKRKKRKVAPIEKSAMEQWAAEMNATFAEAERFDLLVE